MEKHYQKPDQFNPNSFLGQKLKINGTKEEWKIVSYDEENGCFVIVNTASGQRGTNIVPKKQIIELFKKTDS